MTAVPVDRPVDRPRAVAASRRRYVVRRGGGAPHAAQHAVPGLLHRHAARAVPRLRVHRRRHHAGRADHGGPTSWSAWRPSARSAACSPRAAGSRQERSTGWHRQLRLTSLTGRQYVVGKALTGFAVAVPSLVVVFAAAALVERRPAAGAALAGARPHRAARALRRSAALGHLARLPSPAATTCRRSPAASSRLLSLLGGLWLPLPLFPGWVQRHRRGAAGGLGRRSRPRRGAGPLGRAGTAPSCSPPGPWCSACSPPAPTSGTPPVPEPHVGARCWPGAPRLAGALQWPSRRRGGRGRAAVRCGGSGCSRPIFLVYLGYAFDGLSGTRQPGRAPRSCCSVFVALYVGLLPLRPSSTAARGVGRAAGRWRWSPRFTSCWSGRAGWC